MYHHLLKWTFSIIILLTAFGSSAQSYHVSIEAPQFNQGKAYLTHYFGDKLNVDDSALLSSAGKAVFQDKDSLAPGIYVIVLPGKKLRYEFLIDTAQQISIYIPDTLHLINASTVEGSRANKLFQKYQQFVTAQSPLLQKEYIAVQQAATSADSLAHQQKFNQLQKALAAYRNNVVEQHPKSMLAALFNAMKAPEVPYAHPQSRSDSMANYQYYKTHYWDGITFMDDRIVRTPFFPPKLETYFRNVVNPHPDSIIREADYLLLLSRTEPGMYQFLLNWLTDEYISPKYMGQDAVFVHLFEKYHSKGISDWLSEQQHEAISRRAYMMMGNLIGKPAADMHMTDSAGQSKSLYNIRAPYTVICFWDPDCGHCREELPRIDSMYQANWKQHGVQIFAVLTDIKHLSAWKVFIQKHELGDWVNVYETEAQRKMIEQAQQPSFRQLYDVIQTPTLYLLDEEKRIIAKKLTPEQMNEILQIKFDENTGKS